MLLRSPSVVVFPMLLLLMLAVLEEGFSANSTVRIDLSTYDRNVVRVTVPCISTVQLIGVSVQGCEPPSRIEPFNVSGSMNDTIDVTNACDYDAVPQLNLTGSQTKVLHLVVSSKFQVGCEEYLLNKSFDSSSMTFTCVPVYASNISGIVDMEGTEVVWRKFLETEELTEFLAASRMEIKDYLDNDTMDVYNISEMYDKYILSDGPYEPHDEDMRVKDGEEVTILVNDTSISIDVTRSPGRDMIGYYVPSIELQLSEGNVTLPAPYFAVYLSPSFTSSDDRNLSVIEGTSSAENYDKIRCKTTSFPPAQVSWQFRKRGSSGVDQLGDRDVNNSELFTVDIDDSHPKQFRLTLDGKLVIREADGDNAGTYKCIVTNEASGKTIDHSVILRVRDPLRPLWPALGIIASFALTAMFIIGGAVFERVRGKSVTTEEPSAPDQSAGTRLSVTSTAQEEMEAPGGQWHRAAKRVSSTQQELLAQQYN